MPWLNDFEDAQVRAVGGKMEHITEIVESGFTGGCGFGSDKTYSE
jgi:hypothetical protein